ncbi:hypothetical protein V8E36_008616 [Tilletia maclaganii]
MKQSKRRRVRHRDHLRLSNLLSSPHASPVQPRGQILQLTASAQDFVMRSPAPRHGDSDAALDDVGLSQIGDHEAMPSQIRGTSRLSRSPSFPNSPSARQLPPEQPHSSQPFADVKVQQTRTRHETGSAEQAAPANAPATNGPLPALPTTLPEVVIPVRPHFSRTQSQLSSTSSALSDLPETLPQNIPQHAGPSSSKGQPPSPRTAAAVEAAQREHQARQSRSLRTRNPSQLNPYQIEAQRYAAALLRNDWEDALIGQRSVRAQEMRRLAEEEQARKKDRRRAAVDGQEVEDETQDWLVDDMGSSDESVYTEVSDGQGGKKRQARRKDRDASSHDKENMSPTKLRLLKEKKEAKERRRQEKEARAMLAQPATVHHPGIKRARPIAPPPRPRSPQLRPTEDLSYLLPQSDDEMEAAASAQNVRRLPAFMRSRKSGGQSSDSDSSSAPVLTGIKRKRHASVEGRDSSESLTSDNDVGATGGIQPAGLFDNSSADEARVTAMRRTGASASRRRPAPVDEDDGSDSDAEYRRLFKDLRKMMPFHMARKYIEDVKNMRKGKAYHSDGHVSSTPEPSSDEAGRSSTFDRSHQRSTPATSPPPASDGVQPGEARKRMGPRDDAEASSSRFALVGDSQSSSESDAASVVSVSSTSSEDGPRTGTRESDTDQSDRDNHWWTRPTIGRTRAPKRPKDTIDLLLSRAGGKKKTKSKRRTSGHRGNSTARLGPSTSDNGRTMPAGFGKPSRSDQRGSSSRKDAKRSEKRMRQSRLQIHRETRPAIDLLDDDTLFEFDMPVQRADEFAFLNDFQTSHDGTKATPEVRSGPGAAAATPAQSAATASPEASASLAQMATRNAGLLTPATTIGSSIANISIDRRVPLAPVTTIPPALGTDVNRAVLEIPRYESPMRAPGSPFLKQGAAQSGSEVVAGPATGLPAQAQQMDAEAWAAYRKLRVDFGIQPLPFGLHFDATSYLGRGRLAKVLEAADASGQASPQDVLLQSVYAFGLDLRLDMSADDMLQVLPSLFDAMYVAILPESGDPANSSLGIRSSAEAALSFLGRYLSKASRMVATAEFASLFEAVKTHLARTCDRLGAMAKLGSDAHGNASLALRWFAVEYAWRALVGKGSRVDVTFSQVDYALELSVAAQHLMLYLSKHGLHRTFKTIRTAVQSKDDNHVLFDLTAELWICLIHLLHRVPSVAPDAGQVCSFWVVFESANKVLIDRGVGRQRLGASERTWYCIFAICALSQFGPASGMTGDKPALAQHWSLVTFALSLVRFRFDEKTEKTMSSTSIQRRDGYIRVVLQRCLTLSTKWAWRLDQAEVTMSKLFDIFNSHKLCNLPSELERTHDFPVFLCRYDESYLKQLTPEDLGEARGSGRPLVFHVFIKLLARAAYDLRLVASNAADAERRIARLFSRMSPVRTMPFSKTSPPTSIERSILFNHYTMVLLYLLFVPSGANQRLRQLRSFLPFPGADIASQMTCIRSMLYIGVLFRHHDLPLQPVTAWFSEALPLLVQQHEALERQRLSGSKTGPYKDWTATAIYRELRSTSTLLVAALRAIQHILKHPSLDQAESSRAAGYPDFQLLQADWIKTMLEGQVAIDPAIGREAMHTIQEFLKQRNQVIAACQLSKNKTADTTAGQGPQEEESQDSFAGMFDDVDMLMDDPLLASMLGEVAPAPGGASEQSDLNAKDAQFAGIIKTSVSPALFRLLSNVYHPDRAKAGKRISLSFDSRLSLTTLGRPLKEQRLLLEQQRGRQRYVELIVDCWAGCADVLVRNGLRDWDKYFSTFGDESWKRISDPIGRRDVGLRFLNTALQRDPTAYEMYEAEFVSMWFQATVSRLLSIQDKYTRTLLEIGGDSPFFRDMPWSRDPETGQLAKLRDTDFLKHRLTALLQGFANLAAEFAAPPAPGGKPNRKPVIFASVSATVAAIRQNVEDTPMNHPDRKDYLRFCLKVVHGMKERLGPGILRGAGPEVAALETHLVGLGVTLLSSAEEAAARKAQEVDAMMQLARSTRGGTSTEGGQVSTPETADGSGAVDLGNSSKETSADGMGEV